VEATLGEEPGRGGEDLRPTVRPARAHRRTL